MADDAAGSRGQGGFLPPEPGGSEPDLTDGPKPGGQAAGARGYAPPAGAPPGPPPTAQPPAHHQPPPAYQQPPPAYQQPPAAYQQPPSAQQQLGWGAPPQQGWAPEPQGPPPPGQWQQAPQWAWQAPQRYPDNGAAVAGFTLSLISGGLLVLSAGLSSIISIACAGFGIFYSRRGRQKVDRGETPVNRGLAQAGFVIGIIAMVLSVLATAGWAVLGVLYATDDQFRNDFNDGNGGGSDFETTARLAAVGFRVVATLLR
jgi:hypothetical protein